MRVRVVVPATSANLGPGFDALGLALALHNAIELEEGDGVAVSVEGEGAAELPRDGRNVVVRGAQLVYETVGRSFPGITVRQRNGIPPSRGLGSSASAWLAGMLGANALLGGPLDRDRLMDLAVAQEGHPDNVAAALYGGLTATCWDAETRAVVGLPVPAAIEFALLIPGFQASTAAARAALPATYPRGDAVYNVGRVALFLAAWTRGEWELAGRAMGDRLHQPHRARALFPWLDAVIRAAHGAGALGAALSGAGPSVLALAPRGQAAPAAAAMEQALARTGHPGRGIVLAGDPQGARVERLPG